MFFGIAVPMIVARIRGGVVLMVWAIRSGRFSGRGHGRRCGHQLRDWQRRRLRDNAKRRWLRVVLLWRLLRLLLQRGRVATSIRDAAEWVGSRTATADITTGTAAAAAASM
jgi:hypothetical protein